MTNLRSALDKYLSMRKGLGYKYEHQTRRLGDFVVVMLVSIGANWVVGRLLAAARTRPERSEGRGPVGQPRPEYDRTMEPVEQSIAEGWPTILPGDKNREIRRAVRLGEDLGVQTVVAGAHDAYELADELASRGATVLVNLKWPERNRDADPDADESRGARRHTAPES